MTLLTLNMTWRMAVYWKNGAAPSVTPGMRVVMVMSDCDERVEIWMQVSNSRKQGWCGLTDPGQPRRRVRICTDDDRVDFSPERVRGLVESAAVGLDRLPDGQGPHPTTTANSMQFAFRARRHVSLCISSFVSWLRRRRHLFLRTWKRWNPPRWPDPVAIISSGTWRSCGYIR